MGKEIKLNRMLKENTIEVSLPNKLGYERVAMACSASFAKILGFLPERIEDLKTAVSEACLNAIEHGNLKNPDKRVLVSMNYNDNLLSVSVIDEGKGMDDNSEELQIINIKRKNESYEIQRGHGIFLIKQLVDQVEFKRINGIGHVVRMMIRMTN